MVWLCRRENTHICTDSGHKFSEGRLFCRITPPLDLIWSIVVPLWIDRLSFLRQLSLMLDQISIREKSNSIITRASGCMIVTWLWMNAFFSHSYTCARSFLHFKYSEAETVSVLKTIFNCTRSSWYSIKKNLHKGLKYTFQGLFLQTSTPSF